MEKKNRILIVDDEENIRQIIKKYAQFEGYDITEAGDGLTAIELCRKTSFDLVVLDVMLPFLDGFSTCREIKKTGDIPVIMLSARGEEYDRIHGFEVGVDDYIVKPFSPKELMMRIAAVLNRTKKKPLENKIFEIEGLHVDLDARIVSIDNHRIDLTPKEYDLLFYFIKNRGLALSRKQLIEDVWGYDFIGDDRTLDTHIKLLRKSLGPYSRFIVTLRGMGYRFENC